MLNITSTQLYNNIQLSILGIAVVIGFFLLWRILRRIEERISAIQGCQCPAGGGAGGMGAEEGSCFRKPVAAAAAADPAQAAMDIAPDVADREFAEVFTTIYSVPAPTPSRVKIEEAVAETGAGREEDADGEGEEEVTPSEAQSAGGMKRSALYRMSLDALRDLAIEKGISTEGTRKHILDRLLLVVA